MNLKPQFNKKIAIQAQKLGLLLVGLVFTAPALANSDMSISDLKMKICNLEKTNCLVLSSPLAEVSSMKQIYFMKDLNLELIANTDSTGFKTVRRLEGKSGLLDLESNQLVLREIKSDSSLVEQVFNLSTLKESVFVTK